MLVKPRSCERVRDRINGDSANDAISAGSSDDRLAGDQSIDRINGTSGNDVLRSHSSRHRSSGSSGANRIEGGSANDRIAARGRAGRFLAPPP